MLKNNRWQNLFAVMAGSLLIAATVAARPPKKDCYVKVYDGEDFQGLSAIWVGPAADRSLNDNRWSGSDSIIGDDTDSLITGPDAYFEGFEEPAFRGTAIRVWPNTRVADINAVGGNDIESYKLYDQKPAHW